MFKPQDPNSSGCSLSSLFWQQHNASPLDVHLRVFIIIMKKQLSSGWIFSSCCNEQAACRLLQPWMLHAVLVVMTTSRRTLETSHRYRERLVILSFCSYRLSAVPGTRDDDCLGLRMWKESLVIYRHTARSSLENLTAIGISNRVLLREPLSLQWGCRLDDLWVQIPAETRNFLLL